MNGIQLLYPEILLSGLALLLFLADLWIPEKHGKLLYHGGIFSAVVALGMLGVSYSDQAMRGMGQLWIVDPLALFFKALVLIATILVLMLSLDYAPGPRGWAPGRDGGPAGLKHLGSFAALVLIASVGIMLLVSATDLLLIFLALETISISSFILSGFERKNRKSSEGAVKYFLIGAFSSAIMIYGISLFYGAAGTTSLMKLSSATPSPLLTLSTFLILVGFGFKASVAPFHLWVPDAYEGAPTPVTAYLSVAPKVAALAAVLRVFTLWLPANPDMILLLAFLSALTMTIGNFTAIFQMNVKRLLAYSSVAQAGYMLIAVASGGALGREGLLLYSLVYLFMNIGAFAVAILVGNDDSYDLGAYDGLSTRSLGVSLLMAFFLLSLAGIPPTGGFIAKFYVFASAIDAKYYWLAVLGVLNSVVSVYYYLRIVYHMFFVPARNDRPIEPGLYLYSGLAVAAAAVLAIGVYPDPFIAVVKLSAAPQRLSEAALPRDSARSAALPHPSTIALLGH